MEIVENTLEDPLDDVLARPLFCFLGTTSAAGEPRVSPLWFLWQDGHVWILGDTVDKSYTDRIEARPETVVAVVDFDATSGRVHHVGMRGRAELVPLDPGRTEQLLRTYLGDDPDQWDPRFVDLDPDRWSFVRFRPETVVARDQSFAPSLDGE